LLFVIERVNQVSTLTAPFTSHSTLSAREFVLYAESWGRVNRFSGPEIPLIWRQSLKTNFQILIVLFLSVSFTTITGCGRTQRANNNQRSANANAAQSNLTPSSNSQSNSSPAKPSQQPAASTKGTIEVTSVPPGARVLVVSTDEAGAGEPQSKGVTPTTITGLQPGKYTVDLEKPGYRFFQKEVVVKQGAIAKVNAALKKQ
jgi:hypothetical protein